MRTFWTGIAKVIGVIVAAALVVVIIFPDKIIWSLPDWLQDQLGPVGPQIVLEVEPANGDLQHALDESVWIINRRLYELGARAIARQQGPARIVVRLSPSADTKRCIEVATRPGKLEFRLIDATMTAAQAVTGRAPPGSEVLYDSNKAPYLVEKQVLMSGRDIVDAWASFDQRAGGAVVMVRFNSSGGHVFGELTQANVGRSLVIVFDKEVLSAPVIREPILTDTAQIAGAFTVEESVDIATLLRAGELPARLVVIVGDSSD